MLEKHKVFDTIVEIARYYGFHSLKEFLSALPKEGRKTPHIASPKENSLGEANRPGIMRAFLDYKGESLPSPVMIYHTEPLRKYMDREEYGGKEAVLFGLEIIGAEKSIAEALLLKVSFTIMNELGFLDNLSV